MAGENGLRRLGTREPVEEALPAGTAGRAGSCEVGAGPGDFKPVGDRKPDGLWGGSCRDRERTPSLSMLELLDRGLAVRCEAGLAS